MTHPALNFNDPMVRRADGQERVTKKSAGVVELLREQAIRMAKEQGDIDSDRLRDWAQSSGIAPHHHNCWGAVFRGKKWKSVGMKPSVRPEGHGRMIRVWRYVGWRTDR